MKISKLFHWLYALVMLLPIFAVGVTCAYAIFNKNAYKTNEKEYISQYELVNSVDQMIEDFNYKIIYDEENRGAYYNPTIYFYNSVSVDWYSISGVDQSKTYIGFAIRGYPSTGKLNTRLYYSETEYESYDIFGDTNGIQEINFNLNHVNNFNINTSNGVPYKLYVATTLYTNTYDNLNNVFYYSIDKVEQSPLFNWAYDSFLASPITYITALFGIANDHVAVMLLSYWLAISVIWLVFDLIMYVPLLVHRWLDKGVLE